MQFHFDWYQASVQKPSATCLAEVARRMQLLGLVGKEELKGLHSYEYRTEFLSDDGSRHLALMWGGYNPGTNIRGSGHLSEQVADLIRSIAPDHKVSRVDVCVDLSAEGLWPAIKEKVLAFCVLNNVKTHLESDPNNPDMGETLYVGGKKSGYFWRIYQKGFEQLAKGRCSADDFDPHWVRIEAEIKPETRDKARFSRMTPEQMLGYARWGRLLLQELLCFEVAQIKRIRSDKNDFWQKAQYGLSGQAYGGAFIRGGAFLALLDGNKAPTGRDAVRAFLAHAEQYLLSGMDNPDAPVELPFEILDAAAYWSQLEAAETSNLENTNANA